ncbi:hypothetical protein CMUS01_00615 [Colletotrichum musicola]|uniref:Uncharacterized protein n=1 Tax=Colletotrichum musicola TaxID=2175873 RepID=A0A8H6U8T9_9PEZI|nr:hypothetical protein CMUS01_00615 [Colletotrichum musicola]
MALPKRLSAKKDFVCTNRRDVAFYGPNASLFGKFSQQGGSKPRNLKDLTPPSVSKQQQQPASSTLAEWTTLADERCLHSRQIAQKTLDANGAPGFGVGTSLRSTSALTSASHAEIPAPGGNAGRAKKGIARNERMQDKRFEVPGCQSIPHTSLEYHLA